MDNLYRSVCVVSCEFQMQIGGFQKGALCGDSKEQVWSRKLGVEQNLVVFLSCHGKYLEQMETFKQVTCIF